MNTIWTRKSELAWNSMPGRFGSCPGQEIKPGSRIWEPEQLRITQNSKNQKIQKNSQKLQDSSIFGPWKWIFALLTQQIMWIATLGILFEWLVELISLRYWAYRVIRGRRAASWQVGLQCINCSLKDHFLRILVMFCFVRKIWKFN